MTTLLLCHFNGANGATTVADSAASGNWVAAGNASLDTSVKKFGSAAARILDSTDDLWTSPTITASPHAGSWTAEVFFRATGSFAAGYFLVDGALEVFVDPFDDIVSWNLFDSGGGIFYSNSAAITLANATFYHVAVVRSGTTYSLYANGVRLDNTTEGTNVGTMDHAELYTLSSDADCWYDEFRLTDQAQYSGATYTVPSAEFIVGPYTNDPVNAEFSYAAGSVGMVSNLPTNGAELDYETSSVDIDQLSIVVPASCEYDREIESSYLPESAFLRSHEWSSASLASVAVFSFDGSEHDFEITPPSIAMLFNIASRSAEFDHEWEGTDLRYFIQGITPHHRRFEGGRRSLNRRIDVVPRRVDVGV